MPRTILLCRSHSYCIALGHDQRSSSALLLHSQLALATSRLAGRLSALLLMLPHMLSSIAVNIDMGLLALLLLFLVLRSSTTITTGVTVTISTSTGISSITTVGSGTGSAVHALTALAAVVCTMLCCLMMRSC